MMGNLRQQKGATMIYTSEMILAHNPCKEYTLERLQSLMGDGLTVHQIAEHPDVPIEDRIWILCRILDSAIRQQWIARIADRAVRNHALKCGVSVVESWAEKWLNGTNRSVEAAARARVAAWAAWAARAEVATWAAECEQQIKDLLEILEAV
jgi:hypothetical protein